MSFPYKPPLANNNSNNNEKQNFARKHTSGMAKPTTSTTISNLTVTKKATINNNQPNLVPQNNNKNNNQQTLTTQNNNTNNNQQTLATQNNNQNKNTAATSQAVTETRKVANVNLSNQNEKSSHAEPAPNTSKTVSVS